MIVKIQRLNLHVGQQQIISSDARFKVASCGRRFGKTMMASYWLAMREDSAMDGHPVAYFAPTYKLLLDVWHTMLKQLRPVIRRANKTEMRIELSTDGIIDFWTLEDTNAGRGRKYKRIVIDEAAHARYLKDTWEQAIAPTLTDLKGDAWFISTPKGMNFFYELYAREGQSQFPDWKSFHMPSTINWRLPEEEIAARRTELPELVFRQEYLAEFVNFGAGLVKPEHILESSLLLPIPVVLGVDLAISEKASSDFTSIVAMSRAKSGMVYILEVERHRCGFHEVIERIKAAAARHKPIMIAIEQTQYQASVIQELARTTKLPVRGIRPDKDKVTRFLPLLTRYEQGMVRHNPTGVPAWFRDELLSFPNGEHDDGVDAAAYAFMVTDSGIPGTVKSLDQSPSKWV